MAKRVKSSKFCCCIPVRLGVLIISMLGITLGGVIAVGGIIQYTRMGGDIKNKLAYAIQIIVYGLYAIVSVFGLIGTFAKKRRYIVLFRWVLIAHVLFSIASGSFALYRFFVDAPATVRSCIGGSKNGDAIEACKNGVNILKGVLIGVFLFVWVMEIWGCIIVKRYSTQLAEEERVKKDGW